MFSEALRILDQDTVQYMIDDMRKELEVKDNKLKESQDKIQRLEFELAALKQQMAK